MSSRIPEGSDARKAFSPLSLRSGGKTKESSSKKEEIKCCYSSSTTTQSNYTESSCNGAENAINGAGSAVNSAAASNQKNGNKSTTYCDRYIALNVRNIYAVQEEMLGPVFTCPQENSPEELFDDGEINDKSELFTNCLKETDVPDGNRVMRFSQKAPESAEAGTRSGVQFSSGPITRPKWKSRRHIPKIPERILDAPDMKDDYYLNLLHWGNENSIAIGLTATVYVWRANSGDIVRLEPEQTTDDSGLDICSVRWSGISAESCLAVGRDDGLIQIWDVNQERCLRTLRGHTGRVPCLSWNGSILSSGSRSGLILNQDVRLPNPTVSRIAGVHTQEVCGLAWSVDGHYLASGGNDNAANIWTYSSALSNDPTPLHHMTNHQAAIKAVAWNPNEPNVVATGGGMSDRKIYFWNVYNGSILGQISTTSQVSGLIWNPFQSEIISSHGYSQNQLSLWSYPSLQLQANLLGHTQRILSISLNPTGTTVASIAADETLRLWRCFDSTSSRNRNPASSNGSASGSDNGKVAYHQNNNQMNDLR